MASSPAGQAGIQPGDVILEVDGIAVNNPVDLAVMLFRKDVGDKVTVRYLRGLVRGTANMTVASTQVFELGR
jgi:S1-C subfamily serine protease